MIVPAHNSARFLAATLDSVLGQSETRWECVVVDDGSTDATYDIARRYQDRDSRFHVHRTANRGAAAARNTGFRRSCPSSRYVTFMDSDDLWLPHALGTLLRRLEADPAAVGSHGLAELVDESGTVTDPGSYPAAGRHRLGLQGRRLVRWPLDRPTEFTVLINGNVLFPPGLVLARRSAYEAAGPFDETLSGPEDWDMLIRLSRFGHLSFVDDVVLHYRRHDSNLGAGVTVPRQAWLVRCLNFHAPENTPEQRRTARRGWRAYQVMLIEQRSSALLPAVRAGRWREVVGLVGRLGVGVVRYLRGYPRPRVRRAPLVW